MSRRTESPNSGRLELQSMLANMAIAVEGSPALVYAVARMIDSGAKNIAKVVLKARLPILSHVSLHLKPEI